MSTNDVPPADAPPSEEAVLREQARIRTLTRIVTGLGAILVVLMLVVFSTLIVRAVKGNSDKQAATAPAQTLPGIAQGAAPSAAPTATLARQGAIPAGSRVLATALGDGRFAVTLEAGGRIVTIFYDASTLTETGRLSLSATP